VALVQILLRERCGVTPTLQSLPLGSCPTAESIAADAVLLIGDRAMHASRLGFSQQWDLGEQWCRWTGLPFVFAMWTARATLDTSVLETALRQARDAGVAQLEQIAAREAPAAELDEQACLSYLRDNLYFTLGTRERQGLELFLSHARQLGFVSPSHTPVDREQVET
jgi:chorismate dehydratase